MVRLKVAPALLAPTLKFALCQEYQLVQEYNASNIFEDFYFFSDPDPTGGFVQYAPFETAASIGLIGNGSDLVYIGVDKARTYAPGGPGRASVRLESKMTFTEGIFVIDLTHMPVGCGVWPALWTASLGDWPGDGEIDIIENTNEARVNNVALHATGECSITEDTNQTGTWISTDCNIAHDENQGCVATLTEPANYGAEFNANGGGVYAMEWTSSAVRVWFFPPTAVPRSLSANHVGVLDPASFGPPSVSFAGPCSDSFGEKFFNHSIIIDTTFCGGWAGGTFGSGTSSCPTIDGISPLDNCINFVAANPIAFEEAYWGIRSIRAYEKLAGFIPHKNENFTAGVLLPPPITRPFPGTSDTILNPISAFTDIPLLTIETSATFDDDATITLTIVSTKTSTIFPVWTQEPLDAGPQLADAAPTPINSLDGSATLPTAIPDAPISQLEPLLAKITVSIPVSVSPLTGGVLALGNGSGEKGIRPESDIVPDFEHGEGTFPDWRDDPYVGPAEGPFNDAVESQPIASIFSTSPISTGSGIDDGTFRENHQYISSSPLPSETSIQNPAPFALIGPKTPVEENPGANIPLVPPELLENPPPTSIWGSISDDMQGQLLALAAALPTTPAPISNKANANDTGLPSSQPITHDDTSQAVSGLLGLLGEDGKNHLLAFVGGQGTAAPSRQEDTPASTKNEQQHVNEAFASPPIGTPIPFNKTATLITPLAEGAVIQPDPPRASEDASKLLPNTLLTPVLTVSDTSQAVGGILSLLDEQTKKELFSVLFSTPEPPIEPGQERRSQQGGTVYNPMWLTGTDAPPGTVGRRSNKAFQLNDIPHAAKSWKSLVDSLSEDTKTKLDNIITEFANLDDLLIALFVDNPVAALFSEQTIPLINSLSSILDDDRTRLLLWLTGDKNTSVTSFLSNMLGAGIVSSMPTVFENVVEKAKSYAYAPGSEEDENRMAPVFDALKDAFAFATSDGLERNTRAAERRGVSDGGPNFDDLDGSGLVRLLGVFLDSSIGVDRKELLLQQMLDDHDNEQGFLEQQIYAICPNLDALPMAELIVDLAAGTNPTLDTSLKRFRARLEAYTASLRRCSGKVKDYAEALKMFLVEKNKELSQANDTSPVGRQREQSRQTVSGDPNFDAFLQHKHDGDLDKWRYGVLTTGQKGALHTFVVQALACALQSFRRPNNPSLGHDICIANLTAAWIPIAPWITKSIPTNNSSTSPASSKIRFPPEPETHSHVNVTKKISNTETLLDALDIDVDTPSAHHSTPPASPSKPYYDLINPKWMTTLRELALKSSLHPQIPFPILYVQWLKHSVQKNWKHMSKDVHQSIIALSNSVVPTKSLESRANEKNDVLNKLIKDLFGLNLVATEARNGTATPSPPKAVVLPSAGPREDVGDMGDLELVESAETSNPDGSFKPVDYPRPADLLSDTDSEGNDLPTLPEIPQEITDFLNFSPGGSNDPLDNSKIAPPRAKHPGSHLHSHPGVLGPEFADLVDSAESEAPPRDEAPAQANPYANEPTELELDGDQWLSLGDVPNLAMPKPRLDMPYSNAGEELGEQSTPGNVGEDAYGIDDFMHDLFSDEVEVPAHADEDALAKKRRNGYAESLKLSGLSWKDLYEVLGSGEHVDD